MNVWLAIFAVGLLTYATRLSFIVVFGRRDVPAQLRRALHYVPPAVLMAIIFPELLLPKGTLDISLGNERLLAGILAVVVARLTSNVMATIIAGMAALWILQALSP
jgi:branched-subunit amino acid transport protein